MPEPDQERTAAHWQHMYHARPGQYGSEPSPPAVPAAGAFAEAGARVVLELGAGNGRDSLWFAERGFTVLAMDTSAAGLAELAADARLRGVARSVRTIQHDVRGPLPLPAASVDAAFAAPLPWPDLSPWELRALLGELRRVFRPGGVLVYTLRRIDDAARVAERLAVGWQLRGIVEGGSGLLVTQVLPNLTE